CPAGWLQNTEKDVQQGTLARAAVSRERNACTLRYPYSHRVQRGTLSLRVAVAHGREHDIAWLGRIVHRLWLAGGSRGDASEQVIVDRSQVHQVETQAGKGAQYRREIGLES